MHRTRAYSKEYLSYFSNGADEPVVLLSYLLAYQSGEQYFNHALRFYALSPSNRQAEELGANDGELVEHILWSNLREDASGLLVPELSAEFLSSVAEHDKRIRERLAIEVRHEDGRWKGAVWPLAVTVLVGR